MWIDQGFAAKKVTPKNIMGIHFLVGLFQNYPTKSFLNYLGNNLGCNGTYTFELLSSQTSAFLPSMIFSSLPS